MLQRRWNLPAAVSIAAGALVLNVFNAVRLPAQQPAVPAPLPAPNFATLELVRTYDRDGNGRLDATERVAARAHVSTLTRGIPSVIQPVAPPPPPGPRLTPASVRSYGSEPLYDPAVLRTLFLQFESPDWEKELADFNNTDVDVPATLTVDGKVYRDIGVHFRGASSYFTVPLGYKHSMSLSLDFVNEDQRLGGYSSLNLLNAHADPSFLRTVLYQQIAREYFPAPKVNFMRVVINGESWGVYANSQQFNGEFVQERFGSARGVRWKVNGSPAGRGGLNYLGEDPEPYKAIYRIRTRDNPTAWTDLVRLCRVLSETPIDRLQAELEPILDIDSTLKWLAVEKALMNSDGYWVRMSDYNLYQDAAGRFHIISHDANEALREPEGPPRNGPPQPHITPALGVNLAPFAGEEDPAKVLLNRLLKVPALRAKYVAYMREVAETWMDWNRIGPIAERYHALIAADVRTDTHKLYSTAGFDGGIFQDGAEKGGGPSGGAIPDRGLKRFFEERRAFLLSHPDLR